MANEITEEFAQQYAANFIMLSQQKKSRLETTVRVDSGIVGASKTVERMGSVSAQLRTTRHGDSPIMDTPFSRRWVDLADYEWGDMVDDMDKIKLMTDPTSSVVAGGVAALQRAKDSVIIAAARGSARVGTGSSATTTALPSGQKIAHGSAGLTIAKLITARGLLGRAEAYNADDPNDQLIFICSMEQIENMLNIDKVTSADYNSIKGLMTGQVDTFMGFKFVVTQLLPKTAYERYCLAYCKSGVVLGVGADVKTKVAERADKSFSVYAYAAMSLGAVRTEEEKVVEVSCNEVVSA